MLLSADPFAAALEKGLNETADRIDEFLAGNDLLARPLPIIVQSQLDDDGQLRRSAPTISELLKLDVDVDGNGLIGGAVEEALNDRDADGDGSVDALEILRHDVIGPVVKFVAEDGSTDLPSAAAVR